MSSRFKIFLSFSRKSDGSQVYFKFDGRRFNDERTLKLHVNTTYDVVLQCKPALNILSVTIAGVKVDGALTETDTSSTYKGTWSTDLISKTPANQRSSLPVTIEFAYGETVTSILQCKLYPLKDKTHVVWGTGLKCIELKCTKWDGNKFTVEGVTFM